MAPTADDIISGINSITSQLQSLQAPANSLNIINGTLIIVGQGPWPQILAGTASVVATAQAQASFFLGAKDTYDDRANDIYSAVKSVSLPNDISLHNVDDLISMSKYHRHI
jgi:hypothetical protein